MNKIRTAPRCVHCNGECPNGLKDMPLAIICQQPGCPNYGLMQAGLDVMEELDKEFPLIEGH